MLDWLGQEGSRFLELHNWSLDDKQNKKKIIDTLKVKCQSQENAHLYKQQFFLKYATFLKRHFQICTKKYVCIYDFCKFEEEGRCSDDKDCTACKKSARDIRIIDILILAVRE